MRAHIIHVALCEPVSLSCLFNIILVLRWPPELFAVRRPSVRLTFPSAEDEAEDARAQHNEKCNTTTSEWRHDDTRQEAALQQHTHPRADAKRKRGTLGSGRSDEYKGLMRMSSMLLPYVNKRSVGEITPLNFVVATVMRKDSAN